MNKTDLIHELQSLQKHSACEYFSHASECTNPNLRIDFLSIAREESDIITWLNYEIEESLLPPIIEPDKDLVSNVYQKYSSI